MLCAYFGTTLSWSPFLASNASFHPTTPVSNTSQAMQGQENGRLAHKHHLQPPVSPISRRLFP